MEHLQDDLWCEVPRREVVKRGVSGEKRLEATDLHFNPLLAVALRHVREPL